MDTRVEREGENTKTCERIDEKEEEWENVWEKDKRREKKCERRDKTITD